jgi:hypothetical protein
VNGSNQVVGTNYTETTGNSVTFVTGLNVGDIVKFSTATPVATNAMAAANVAFTGANGTAGNVQDLADSDGSDWVGFIQSGTGAVSQTAQDKLRETVSVKDFGAVGDGATDDTTAIQATINAVNALTMNGAVYIPSGTYKISTSLNVPYGVSIYGDGGTASILQCEDCDGLTFTTFSYQIGSMFYEDFGLTANSGTNRVGIVSLNSPTTTTQDGLYFNRLRFYGWNQCVVLSSTWNTTISNCVAQNINNFVTLGQSNGQTIGTRIINNRMTYASGGLGSGDKYAIDIVGTTSFNESVHILQNQIFGFVRNINAYQCTFLNVIGNDLSGSSIVIALLTPNGGYNICNNYIEVTGTGTGIVCSQQSVETHTTRTNIEQNYFVAATGTALLGIEFNSTINTHQWNATIRDNTFTGFVTADIRLYACGKTLVDNNRCMSTTPTNSIFLGQVLGSPVILTNNYFNKAVFADVPADITDGKLILQNNVESNSFQSTRQAAAPTTGTWRVGDIVYNNAPASAGYVGFVCTVAGTPGTWKSFGLIS